jgi:hypothetical protein
MKKKEQPADMVKLFKSFKNAVLDKNPTYEQMVQDVRMMKFKIRPINGDFSYLNFGNHRFVETLWKLGKMDDFIEKNVMKINKKQERAFFNYFDGLYRHLQDSLNSIHLAELTPDPARNKKNVVEMEIFKERGGKRRTN